MRAGAIVRLALALLKGMEVRARLEGLDRVQIVPEVPGDLALRAVDPYTDRRTGISVWMTHPNS